MTQAKIYTIPIHIPKHLCIFLNNVYGPVLDLTRRFTNPNHFENHLRAAQKEISNPTPLTYSKFNSLPKTFDHMYHLKVRNCRALTMFHQKKVYFHLYDLFLAYLLREVAISRHVFTADKVRAFIKKYGLPETYHTALITYLQKERHYLSKVKPLCHPTDSNLS